MAGIASASLFIAEFAWDKRVLIAALAELNDATADLCFSRASSSSALLLAFSRCARDAALQT